MNAFEPLFWIGIAYLLVRIKHSTVLFAAAVFVAPLLTLVGRHFAQEWIWLGGLLAFAIALPNIVWETRYHWPT